MVEQTTIQSPHQKWRSLGMSFLSHSLLVILFIVFGILSACLWLFSIFTNVWCRASSVLLPVCRTTTSLYQRETLFDVKPVFQVYYLVHTSRSLSLGNVLLPCSFRPRPEKKKVVDPREQLPGGMAGSPHLFNIVRKNIGDSLCHSVAVAWAL